MDTTAMDTAEAWGGVYAVLDVITKGGLQPHDIIQGAECPAQNFATIHNALRRRMPKWADSRICDLIAKIPSESMSINYNMSDEQQSQWFIGFYHEKSRLSAAESSRVTGGRPTKGSQYAVDWTRVDWSLSNAEISRMFGVTRQVASIQRKRHATAPGE
ncbi:MAG: hypothetical protein LBD42_04615 [Desulfovibrio sp.]|nr:hypothetical protein [Desulfovibrio sp.]